MEERTPSMLISESLEPLGEEARQYRMDFFNKYVSKMPEEVNLGSPVLDSDERFVEFLGEISGRGAKIAKQYHRYDLPGGYFNPEVVGRLPVLKNIYSYLEVQNKGRILPTTKIFKLHFPHQMSVTLGVKNNAFAKLREILFIILPRFIKVLSENDTARTVQFENLGLPDIFKGLTQAESSEMSDIVKRYDNFISFKSILGNKRLIDIFNEFGPGDKAYLSELVFSHKDPLNAFKNAYFFLDSFMKTQGIRYPELLSGYVPQCKIPAQLFKLFGVKVMNLVNLRYRCFDEIPRVSREITEHRMSPEKLDYMKKFRLSHQDWAELMALTKSYEGYGHLTEEKLSILKGKGTEQVSKIFFKSASFDGVLAHRDTQNISTYKTFNEKKRAEEKERIKKEKIPKVPTLESPEDFRREAVKYRIRFFKKNVANIPEKIELESSVLDSDKSFMKFLREISKRGAKVKRRYRAVYGLPGDYFNPEVVGRLPVLKNIYSYLETQNKGRILPTTKIHKLHFPYQISITLGMKGNAFPRLREVLFIIVPRFIKALSENDTARIIQIRNYGLPNVFMKLTQTEARELEDIAEKYGGFISLESRVGDETVIDVFHKSLPHDKEYLSDFIFSDKDPLNAFKNAYIFLEYLLKREGIEYPESFSGGIAHNKTPATLFQLFGLDGRDVANLRYRCFDEIPRISREITEHRMDPEGIDYMRRFKLRLQDWAELRTLTKRYQSYGHLTEQKMLVLNRRQPAWIYQIFFNSALFDVNLRERDIENVKAYRRFVSKGREGIGFAKGDRIPAIIFRKFAILVGEYDELNKVMQRGQDVDKKIHVYLDKSVVFRYAERRLFGGGNKPSVDLVSSILQGTVKGTVSLDCVKSLYNHLRWKMCQPETEGGKNLSKEKSEEVASTFVKNVFFDKDIWNFANWDEKVLRGAFTNKGDLSFEDTVEYRTFLQAGSTEGGPLAFVTLDAHFPDGVHPIDVLTQLPPEEELSHR